MTPSIEQSTTIGKELAAYMTLDFGEIPSDEEFIERGGRDFQMLGNGFYQLIFYWDEQPYMTFTYSDRGGMAIQKHSRAIPKDITPGASK